MTALTLSEAELEELTRYRQASAQLAELHRQGFARARLDRFGRVVLERAHYEAICSGAREQKRPALRLRGVA